MPRPRTTMRRRAPLTAVLALSACALSGLLASPPASAFLVLRDHDADGRVSIAATDHMVRAYGGSRDAVRIAAPELTAWHLDGDDTADTTQTVVVDYLLQRRDGSALVDGRLTPVWTDVDRGQHVADVAPGASAPFPGWDFPRPDSAVRHEYRVKVHFSWFDPATHYWLGSTTIVPSLWGDAVCDTDPATVACAVTDSGGISV